MTTYLTFRCDGVCENASTGAMLRADQVTSIQAGGSLQTTKHLCNAECMDKFMDGTISGADIFLQDEELEADPELETV